MSDVTIDTNHVTVHNFDMTIDRKYVTKDDDFYVMVDSKEVTEIMWHLAFAPCELTCHNKHMTVGRFDVIICKEVSGSKKGTRKGIRCHVSRMGIKS